MKTLSKSSSPLSKSLLATLSPKQVFKKLPARQSTLSLADPADSPSVSTLAPKTASPVRPVRRLIIGLANPDADYRGTRHNVGGEICRLFMQSIASGDVYRLGESESFSLVKASTVEEDDIASRPATLKDKKNRNKQNFILHFSCFFQDRRRHDLLDMSSERRRKKTAQDGVPFPHVECWAMVANTCFINHSGRFLRSQQDKEKFRFKKNPLSLGKGDEVLVLYDDYSLPVGRFKVAAKGSSGGHNGVKNIISCLGTERFGRIKIGVGKPEAALRGEQPTGGEETAKFVLSKFNEDERHALFGLASNGRRKGGNSKSAKKNDPEQTTVAEQVNHVLTTYMHRGLESAMNIGNAPGGKANDKKPLHKTKQPGGNEKRKLGEPAALGDQATPESAIPPSGNATKRQKI